MDKGLIVHTVIYNAERKVLGDHRPAAVFRALERRYSQEQAVRHARI